MNEYRTMCQQSRISLIRTWAYQSFLSAQYIRSRHHIGNHSRKACSHLIHKLEYHQVSSVYNLYHFLFQTPPPTSSLPTPHRFQIPGSEISVPAHPLAEKGFASDLSCGL